MHRSDRTSKRRYRPRLETLEDRLVPTSTLYIDYGDRFPGDQLVTTVGALDSTVAGDNPDIDGPELRSSEGGKYDGDRSVKINSVNALYGLDAAAMRRVMTGQAQRAFAPLDVTVVELTTNFQTVNGHRVRAAASLADISRTLGVNEGDAENNDAYVLVGQFLIGPNDANPRTFATNGYGGLATRTDIDDDNDNDGTAVVCLVGTGDIPMFDGSNIAHEAGHLFGLQHAYRQDGNSIGADYDVLHQSEIMSYLSGTSQGGYNIFSRYPMIEGDGNDDRDDLAAEPTPFDQMRRDPNIGPANGDGVTGPAALEYVTGTGAHDVITITKTGPNSARVIVAAYTDAAHTSLIRVPGPDGGFGYSYDISLDRPLRIDAGGNNDRVVLSGDLGVSVNVRGMHGEDELVVFGGGAASGHYIPAATATMSGGDGNPDYRGTVVYGNTVVYFQEFEPTSRVTVQSVTDFTLRTPGSYDQITIDGADVLGRANTANGTSDGVSFVPLTWQNVRRVTIDTGTNDRGGTAANDRVTLSAPGPVAPGLTQLTVATGKGADEFLVDDAVLGGFATPALRFEGGDGDDRLRVSGDLNYHLDNGLLTGPYAGIALDSVAEAFLTGGDGDNSFSSSSWTGSAWLDGGGGTDQFSVTRSANFTLDRTSDAVFGITVDRLSISDGARFLFRRVEEASLGELATSNNRVTINNVRSGGADALGVVTVDTGDGADQFILHGSSARLNVYTGGGSDIVTLHDSSLVSTTIDAGADDDQVTVHMTSGRPVTVEGGDGADTFVVTPNSKNLAAAARGLALNGGAGSDTLTVHDQNNPYQASVFNGLYDVTAVAVQRYRPGVGGFPEAVGFAYSSVSQVTLHAGGRDDVIRVHRPSVTVKAGGGDDEIHVAPETRDLATAGAVLADGEDGTDKVFLYDENNPYDTAFNRGLYTLAAGQLTRFYQPFGFPSPLQLTVGYITEELDVRTGWQADTVIVNSAPGETKLDTEAGVDQIGVALAGLLGKLIVLGGADRAFLTLGGTGAAGETHTYGLDATGPAFILDVDGARRVQGGELLGVTLNTAESNDDVTVRDTAVPMAINTNGGDDRVTVESVGAALGINGGAGLDEFFVTPTAGNIDRVVGLSLDGGAGGAALSINDTNRTYGALGSTNYTIASDQVSRVGRVRVGDPPSLVALGFLNVTSLSVDTGGSGDDVSVYSTPGPTTINAGGGDDIVRLGGTARNWQLTPHIEVNGGDGRNRLIMDDRNNPYNFTGLSHKYAVTDSAMWRFYAGAGGGLFQATVYYGDVNELTLMTGDRALQGDEVRVVGTPGDSTIDSGAGLDQFIVGPDLTQIRGKLTIDAAGVPGEPNILTVDDRAGPLGILHYNQLNVVGDRTTVDVNFAPRIDAGGISAMTFYGSATGDFFSVRANVVPTAIYGGAGNDTITVATSGGALAGALGAALHISGDADSDILDISDANAGAGGSYTLTSTALYVSDFSRELLTYGVDDLRISLSNYPDTMDITGNPYPALVSVNGGGSDGDILTGSNLVNLFLILGLDTGLHTYGTTSYASFENLHGDFGTDLFVFQGGSVSGTIQGMDGTDTLNYSSWIDPVQVSLLEGRASAVGGGMPGKISGIENVIGGWGADELIGDDQANGLFGGAGADRLMGGDDQDILIGGIGIDVLMGGAGEDLLIGGSVVISNPTDYGLTLTTLRNHWARTDLSYEQRVALIQTDLISTPVQDDLEPDELWGQGDRDWFWADFADWFDRDESLLEALNLV